MESCPNLDYMTTQDDGRFVPEITRGWRLKIARAHTGLGVRDFAERIGVSHGTVTSAELDQREVRPITLKMWAMVTGVDLRWLETGVPPAPDNDGGDSVGEGVLETPTFRVEGRVIPIRTSTPAAVAA